MRTNEHEGYTDEGDLQSVKRPRQRPWIAAAGWTTAGFCILLFVLGGVGLRTGVIRWIYRDGDAFWDSRDRPQLRNVLWSPPRQLKESNDPKVSVDPTHGHLAPTSIVQALQTERGDYDIYVRRWRPTGWTPAIELGGKDAAFHTTYDEITPALNVDRSTLYFASNRPGGAGGFDLYASDWTDSGWDRPVNLGEHLNSPFDDVGPSLHPRHSVLVFSTNRPRTFILVPPVNWDDVPLDNWKASDFDLAYAVGHNGHSRSWSEPQALLQLSSSRNEKTPAFSPGGTFLYFASDRESGLGGFDLYRARCQVKGVSGDEVTTLLANDPLNVGPPINTKIDDGTPSLFLEGFAMTYQVSDPEKTISGYFVSHSHEVDSELSFAAIPQEILGEYIVQLGGMVLAGLAIIIGTWVLLRYRHFWAMNLLARCAVGALIFHAALFYFFYFWRIGSDFVKLAPQAVLAEVSIEKTLQAKLSLETQRLRIEAPDYEPTQSEPSYAEPALQQGPLFADPSSQELALEVSEVPEFVSDVSTQPVPLSVPPPPKPTLSTLPTADRNIAGRFYGSSELPTLEALKPTAEIDALPSGETNSLRVEANTPKPGPVSPIVQAAGAQPRTQEQVLVEAHTQVRAQVPLPDVLPPLARPNAEITAAFHELAVPAQTSEPTERFSEHPKSPTTTSISDSPTVESNVANPGVDRVTAQPTTREGPSTRWSLSPVGLTATTDDSARLRSTLHLPTREPPPMPAADQLPENAAVANVASKGGEAGSQKTEARPILEPRSHTPEDLVTTGPLVTTADLPELKPKIAPSASKNLPTSASPAALALQPSPGSIGLPSSASTMQPLPGVSTLFPDGEEGEHGEGGGREISDVIGSKPRYSSDDVVPKTTGSRLELTSETSLATEVASAHSASPNRLESGQHGVTLTAISSSGPTRDASVQPSTFLPHQPALPAPELDEQLDEKSPQLTHKVELKQARSEMTRKLLVKEMGGTRESENAVAMGLEWLAACQSRDGRWDVDGFLNAAPDSGTPGFHVQCDVALTGLAILCFLGQNHSPSSPTSPYRDHVARALRWLLRTQGHDGLLAGEDGKYTMYDHGIATLALGEAFILSRDEKLKRALERAVQIILRSQNPRTGGWRYQPVPPLRGDTSISGWQIMALTSARNGGLEVPDVAFERARHWLDVEVSSGVHRGIYGYSRPEEPRVAMVAEGMLMRQLLGARHGDSNVEEAARYIHTQTRTTPFLDNLYLIYYGTLSLYQYQGWIWERWNSQVRDFLVRTQHKHGPRAGSWDPTGPWSESGGQVVSTCFAILSLEVYYRYLPLFWQAKE